MFSDHNGSSSHGDGATVVKAIVFDGGPEPPPRAIPTQPGAAPDELVQLALLADPVGLFQRYVRAGWRAGSLEAAWLFDRGEGRLRHAILHAHDLRGQVYVLEALREGTADAQVISSTDDRILRAHADALADSGQGLRLRKDELAFAWLRDKLDEADAELTAAETAVLEWQERVVDAKEAARRRELDDADGERRRDRLHTPTLFEQQGIHPAVVVGVAVADTVATTALLTSPVTDTIDVSSMLEAYLIAGTLGLTFLVVCAVSGRMLSAIRLPQRIVAAAFVAAFGAITWKFFPALNELRHSDEHGVVALTCATFYAGLVACAFGYADGVFGAAADKRANHSALAAVEGRAGSKLEYAIEGLDRARKARDDAEQRKEGANGAVEAMRQEILTLDDNAERGDVVEADLLILSDEARARQSIRTALARTAATQEADAAMSTIAAAEVAHALGRYEAPAVDEDDAAASGEDPATNTDGELRRLLVATKVAAGALGAGAVVGLITGASLVYAGGAGLGAAALLAALLGLGRRLRPSRGEGAPPEPRDAIRGLAQDADGVFMTQPNHTIN
jgi:hypothetical protein